MHGEEQVEVWFLQRLSNCIQFPLVATAVICLRFAVHRADEVAVYAHGQVDNVSSDSMKLRMLYAILSSRPHGIY